MVDILKITSPVAQKNKIENISKQLPKDVAFDINNLNPIEKKIDPDKSTEKDTTKQFLLKNLNKEIYEPLLNSTKAEADTLRKLVLMSKLFETSSGIITQKFLDDFFLKPEQMLSELLKMDKNETIFKGDLFDNLRLLSKLPNQPKLKEAIVLILKSFDCYTKQESSLDTIIVQSKELVGKLGKVDAGVLNQAVEKLMQNVHANKENQKQITTYIKSEFVPNLIRIAKANKGDQQVHNRVTSIVHNIMRYDSGDPLLLEEAIFKFGEELSRLTNLSNTDIVGIKKLAFEHANAAKGILSGIVDSDKNPSLAVPSENKDTEIASLIMKGLDSSSPSKIAGVAQNLLQYMIQNESPILPFMHFTIPLRFLDENTYGEFFIDKDCTERRGEAKEAKNIFFTIQSDKYGNFEVDLLEKDKVIELDIRCPELLIDSIKEFKTRIRSIIEDQRYRLANYQVGVYRDSYTILDRFPKLALRKVGIDVKI